MKKNLVKRFFAEEDGMEVMQVVLIAAIAVSIAIGVYNIYQNYMHDQAAKKVKEMIESGGTTMDAPKT